MKEKDTKERIIQLSEIQKAKLGKLDQQENMLNAELQKIQAQKNDLLVVILDAHGLTQEEIESINQLRLNDNGDIIIS